MLLKNMNKALLVALVLSPLSLLGSDNTSPRALGDRSDSASTMAALSSALLPARKSSPTKTISLTDSRSESPSLSSAATSRSDSPMNPRTDSPMNTPFRPLLSSHSSEDISAMAAKPKQQKPSRFAFLTKSARVSPAPSPTADLDAAMQSAEDHDTQAPSAATQKILKEKKWHDRLETLEGSRLLTGLEYVSSTLALVTASNNFASEHGNGFLPQAVDDVDAGLAMPLIAISAATTAAKTYLHHRNNKRLSDERKSVEAIELSTIAVNAPKPQAQAEEAAVVSQDAQDRRLARIEQVSAAIDKASGVADIIAFGSCANNFASWSGNGIGGRVDDIDSGLTFAFMLASNTMQMAKLVMYRFFHRGA